MNQPLAYVHPGAKIAKNVVVEPFATISNNVEIGEGTWVGSNVTVMEGARIGKNCNIGQNVVIAAKSGVTKSINDNSIVAGFPAVDIKEWKRKVIKERKNGH